MESIDIYKIKLLELKEKSGLSDKDFWEGVKIGTKKGWWKRDGMEIEIQELEPAIGNDEILVMALYILGPEKWHNEMEVIKCFAWLKDKINEKK